MFEKVKFLVGFAYESMPLYRKLYQKKPELNSIADFKKLPYLTVSDFVLCSIEDVLSDMDEPIAILPPIENKTIFPFPRLENSADRDRRYEIFYFFLNRASIADRASFLIITDASHSYYCGEIANNLLFYKHPAWIMFLRDHSMDEIQALIDRLEPDCLLLGMDRIPDKIIQCGVSYIFTINHYDQNLSSNSIYHFDIYAVSEIGWIGIRAPGEPYIFPDEYFYMEVDPVSNALVLTTLAGADSDPPLQPFIRYKTSDRGKILENNLVQVTYIGEH